MNKWEEIHVTANDNTPHLQYRPDLSLPCDTTQKTVADPDVSLSDAVTHVAKLSVNLPASAVVWRNLGCGPGFKIGRILACSAPLSCEMVRWLPFDVSI
jgi:hypothetical protein